MAVVVVVVLMELLLPGRKQSLQSQENLSVRREEVKRKEMRP